MPQLKVIYDFEIEADASHQYEAVESQVWDIKEQKLTEVKEAEETAFAPGDLDPTTIGKNAGAEKYQLVAGIVQAEENEAQAWANAKMIKSRMAMVKGRIRVDGNGTIKPGTPSRSERLGTALTALLL